MKISVIITTYQYGRYIKAAIDSELNQTIAPESYETIVVFRESGDETRSVLLDYQYRPRFHVIEQTGRGLAQASNLGITQSQGDYIIRLDADDQFFPQALLTLSGVLDEQLLIDFVYPDYVYFIEATGERRLKTLPAFDPEELLRRGDFLSGGTMYRKRLFERVGGYDESLETLESYEFILRLMKNNIRGMHVDAPLFEYRIHETSMSQDTAKISAAGKHIAERYGVSYHVGDHHPRKEL